MHDTIKKLKELEASYKKMTTNDLLQEFAAIHQRIGELQNYTAVKDDIEKAVAIKHVILERSMP